MFFLITFTHDCHITANAYQQKFRFKYELIILSSNFPFIVWFFFLSFPFEKFITKSKSGMFQAELDAVRMNAEYG